MQAQITQNVSDTATNIYVNPAAIEHKTNL
jgi:hypothetical protein